MKERSDYCPNCGPKHKDSQCMYRFNYLSERWILFDAPAWKNSIAEAHQKLTKLFDKVYNPKVSLKEENEILRKLLWLNHKCNGSPYGDDGEMQCHGIDFKRDPISMIDKSFYSFGK